MKATILTIKFEPKWILDSMLSGKSSIIDDVLEALRKRYEDANIFVIEKEFHICKLLIASNDGLDNEKIKCYIKEDVDFITDKTKFDIKTEVFEKELLEQRIDSLSRNLNDDLIKFIKAKFDIDVSKKTKKQEIEKLDSSADVEASSFDDLVGMQQFKSWINEVEAIGGKFRDISVKANFFQNMVMLLSINRGNGLTTVLEIMSKKLKEHNLIDFNGRRDFMELPLRYDKENGITYVHKFIDRVCSNGYRGMVAVNIEEWIDHLNEKAFDVLLDFVWNYKNDIFFIFVVPFIEDDALKIVREKLNDILNVRTLKFVPPSDKEYFQYFSKLFNKFEITVEEDVFGCFIRTITNEKNDGRFYGFNTIKKIADEVLYKLLVNAAKNEAAVPKAISCKMYSDLFCYDDEYEVSGLEQLEDMIALKEVKSKVQEILATVKLQKEMYNSGQAEIKPCLHMMFSGNPGTGKTVVARIIGRIFKEEGILPLGNFFETSRKDFVGEYVGKSAPKTMETCRSAIGSVLFIDEAYTLACKSDSYSAEAIGTLIAEMENNRDKMVVIFAGYEKELEELFDMNPGLRDRIPHKVHFPNYNKDELKQIFYNIINKKMRYDDRFKARVNKFFNEFPDSFMQSREFSNGRFIRNLVERILSKAALRFDMSDIDVKEFELSECDFEVAIADNDFGKLIVKPSKSNAIGY